MNLSIVQLINAINQMEQVRKLKNFKYQRAEEAAMMFLVKAMGRRMVPITIEVENTFDRYSYSDVTITLRSSANDYWTRVFMNIFQIIEYIKSHNKIDNVHMLWLREFLDGENKCCKTANENECEEIVTCIIADMVCHNYLKKSDGIDALINIKVSPESSLLFMKETEYIPDDDPKYLLKL